jgi:hypothetical protein
MTTADLSTTYLGFRLPHPFMAGASPLVDHLDTVRRLEDAGSAAIVMHSLFEEQITAGKPAASITWIPSTNSSRRSSPTFRSPSATRSVQTSTSSSFAASRAP